MLYQPEILFGVCRSSPVPRKSLQENGRMLPLITIFLPFHVTVFPISTLQKLASISELMCAWIQKFIQSLYIGINVIPEARKYSNNLTASSSSFSLCWLYFLLPSFFSLWKAIWCTGYRFQHIRVDTLLVWVFVNCSLSFKILFI